MSPSEPGAPADAAALLAGAGLHPLRLDWLPDGTAVLSRHARRWAARIDLQGRSGPTAVYVKWFAAPRWRDLLTGRGWRTPASAEAAALRRLAAAGVRCPAVLEVRRGGGLVVPGASRLVCTEVPGRSLFEALPPAGRARRAAAREIGETCQALARAGLGHPDLHCGHVLLGGPAESPTVGVIDAARVGPSPDLTTTFLALAASCPDAVSRADRWRVLRGGLGAGRRDPGVRAMAERLGALVPEARVRLQRRAVAAIRPEIVLDGDRLRADEDALEGILAYAFETCTAFREGDRGQVVRERLGYQNVRWHLRGAGPELRWFGKRYLTRPWAVRWRAWVGLEPAGDPALREWAMLRRCRALGIRVPAPVAVGLPGARGEPSFVVTAEERGARPLDDVLRETPASVRTVRVGLAHALADVVHAFHAAGFTHRDLYLNHVLAAESPAGPVLTLIDLARVERDAPWAEHRLVKDLGALEYSAAPLTTRTERWRWWRHYRRGAHRTAEAKRLARAAVAKAAAIRAHEARVEARRTGP